MPTIKAQINSTTSSGPQQVSVTVPSATKATTFTSLNDVNATNLTDGALIQYDASTQKFTTRNELSTTTGTIKFNGGNF
jgi:phage baseplate assembly protein gpV